MMTRLLVLVFVGLTAWGREPVRVQTVGERLAAHVSEERFSAGAWGIKVVSLESGKVLFETNAAKLLKPASNAKLYSGALALDRFGPNYRIRTSIYAKTKPDARGVLEGDLVLFGRGDPSISARFQQGSYSNLLGRFVGEIQRAGVKTIKGDLVGDESYFSGPRQGSGWTWDDLTYYYGAEVSALSVQDNVVDLTVKPGSKAGTRATVQLKPQTDYLEFIELPMTVSGGERSVSVHRGLNSRQVRLRGTLSITNEAYVDAVTVPDPALWFVTMLREALAEKGIRLEGKVRSHGWPQPATDLTGQVELGAVESKPMSELVEQMMKPSQNLYAQLLLLQAGAQEKEGGSTEERGVRALRRFLEKAGIARTEVLLEEGSGLSRSCLVTANATVTLLKWMAKHEHGAEYRNALPEPGEGTLRRRLPDLKGRLRAKTGTLRYVNSLSGYLITRAGERLAFSILLNAYDPPGGVTGREEIDTIVRALASLEEKTK